LNPDAGRIIGTTKMLMNKLKYFIFISIPIILACSLNRYNLACNVEITHEFVYFKHCYNGLAIYPLKLNKPLVTSYPTDFIRTGKIDLVENESFVRDEDLKVSFNKKNNFFQWQVFQCKNFDPLKCFPDSNNYIMKDTIQLFKSNTWYEFDFNNPAFIVYVFSDSSGVVTYTKKKFPTNF
jgi:hypothetical protein